MKTQAIYNETHENILHAMWQSFLTSSLMTRTTEWFGQMLEEHISPQQTLRLIHAQLAFAALILFGGITIATSLLLFAWFGLSVLQYWRNQEK
ncbi:MAG: hypothetical protein K5945_08195 [Bacteroidaceae bacterium]|nr:hypothetical protein [Bacteroidaceae bacterium]